MQEVTGSSPVSPTIHHFHAQTDRITASRPEQPVAVLSGEQIGALLRAFIAAVLEVRSVAVWIRGPSPR